MTINIPTSWNEAKVALGKWLVKSTPFYQAFATGADLESPGGAVLSNAYAQSVWVYGCISRKAEQLAQVSFKFSVGQKRGEQLVETGDIVELFNSPNECCDRFEFWELLASWLDLRGEAFIIALGRAGEVLKLNMLGGRGASVEQLLILPPDRFREIVQQNRLEGWQYTGHSLDVFSSFQFLPEEVLHIKRSNPFSPWRGFSPLTVARLAAETDYASGQFQKGLMVNNADTGLIVTTEQSPSDEQRAQILASLRERKRKAGTADRPLFLWGGSKVEKPQVSSADMQFLENRKYSRQEICAVFGVPQEILGYTEDANRSVSESARLNFVENTMQPLGDRLEAALQVVVAAFGSNLVGWFDWWELPIMREAQRARIDSATKLWAMGVPFADANQTLALGMPERPWHKKGYLPFSVTPAEEMAAEPPQEIPDETEPEDETELDKRVRQLDQMLRRKPTTEGRDPKNGCQECKGGPSSTAYLRSIKGSVKAKEGRLRGFFVKQQRRVLDKVEEVFADSTAERQLRPTTKEDLPDSLMALLMALEFENRELIARLQPLLIKDVEFGAAQVFFETGLDDFKIPPQRAIDFMAQRVNKIEGINRETFDQLKGTLGEGLQNGDTFKQLVERVKGVYKTAKDSRAVSIATTETNTAINQGRMAAMEEAEIELKAWRVSNLPGVRASHAAAQAEGAIPRNQPFSNGLMHPSDPNGPPAEVINCRCFMIAVLDEEAGAPAGEMKHLSFEEFCGRGEVKP